MLPQFLINYLVFFGLVILRVGVPLALAVAVGRWLEKKLRPLDGEEARERKSARIIPFPGRKPMTGAVREVNCWDVKKCDSTLRAQCAAYRRPELPCWLAIQAAQGRLRDECSTCDLYRRQHAMA